MPNYYSLSGHSTHVIYRSEGAGPIVKGQPPPGASLEYTSGSVHVVAQGETLEIAKTNVGQLVTATISLGGLPGATTYFSVLIPDANVSGGSVSVRTVGVLTQHREVANIGPGQLETYTELALQGTASNVIVPAAVAPSAQRS